MSIHFNAVCPICGEKYYKCGQCANFKAWKAIADKYEHYQIAMILTEYREGIANAEEATKQFDNIGITLENNFSEYLPAVARDIKKIISDGNKEKEHYMQKPKKNKGLSNIDR